MQENCLVEWQREPVTSGKHISSRLPKVSRKDCGTYSTSNSKKHMQPNTGLNVFKILKTLHNKPCLKKRQLKGQDLRQCRVESNSLSPTAFTICPFPRMHVSFAIHVTKRPLLPALMEDELLSVVWPQKALQPEKEIRLSKRHMNLSGQTTPKSRSN